MIEIKERRQSGSINWLAIKSEGISADDLNNLLDRKNIKVEPINDNYFAPTRYCDYYCGNQSKAYLQNGANVITLFYIKREEEYKGKRFLGFTYTPKKYSIKLNGDDSSAATGREAFNYVNELFVQKYGKSIRVAFGYSPECLNCIPAPLNEGRINPEIYTNFYKADISSAYATEACKPLPTTKGSKTLPGSHKPTKEFPFAFYPKEGKLAILGEGHYLYDVPLVAEYTLLCPMCEYTFKDILYDIYLKKEAATGENRQYFKDILNYFVGWLHWRPKDKITGEYALPGSPQYQSNCPRYAALAAVIKARCNARVLELRNEIEKYRGNQVVLINTDAVGWTGHDMPHIYTTTKGLGNLILEHKNAEAIILGSKRYQIKNRDGTLITKWAGVRKDITQKMKWKDIYNNEHKPRYKVWDWKLQRVRYKTQEELDNEEEV